MTENDPTPVEQTVLSFTQISDEMLNLLHRFANSPERFSESDREFVAGHLLDIGMSTFNLLLTMNHKIMTCSHVRKAITPILPVKVEKAED